MEIGNTFDDLQSYLENMAKGLKDKLFFLEHLPSSRKYVFVDFGCADGTLIEALYHMYPWQSYIGYDISETMIKIAKTKFTQDSKNVLFTSDWTNVVDKIDSLGRDYQVVTILSSVVLFAVNIIIGVSILLALVCFNTSRPLTLGSMISRIITS